jgi:hypothetical protein
MPDIETFYRFHYASLVAKYALAYLIATKRCSVLNIIFQNYRKVSAATRTMERLQKQDCFL